MTIVCIICKSPKPGPKPSELGASRVILTRRKTCRVLGTKHKQRRSVTIVRTRECLKCRYRWKTYELPYPTRSAKAAGNRMRANGTH